jgi:hypothetical protein
VQWDHLNVDLRHGGQQIGNARALFLRVYANLDRSWRVLRHSVYSSPPVRIVARAFSSIYDSWRTSSLPQEFSRNPHQPFLAFSLETMAFVRPSKRSFCLSFPLSSLHFLLNVLRCGSPLS